MILLYRIAKIGVIILLFFFEVCLAKIAKVAKVEDLRPIDLLPEAQVIKGWTSVGKPETYSGKMLFDYINGGAELYLEYNFRELCVQEFKKSDISSLTIEIYEMDIPENAYGLYSLDQDGEHPPIGQGACYNSGQLKFWKHKFFCRITSLSQEKEVKEEVFSIGQEIVKKIPIQGDKPEILSSVPRELMIPGSIRYFHQRIALNNIFYISNKNILNINSKTEGVFFKYSKHRIDDEPGRVIFIKYLTTKDCQTAYKEFIRFYFKIREEAQIFKGEEFINTGEDGKYIGVRLVQNFLVIVLDAEDMYLCRKLLERCSSSIAFD